MSQETLCKCGHPEHEHLKYVAQRCMKAHCKCLEFQPQEAPAPCVHGCVDGRVFSGQDDSFGYWICPDHGKAPAQGDGREGWTQAVYTDAKQPAPEVELSRGMLEAWLEGLTAYPDGSAVISKTRLRTLCRMALWALDKEGR